MNIVSALVFQGGLYLVILAVEVSSIDPYIVIHF
jgi:hypothetical protein